MRDDYNSVNDEVREITREHSSSPSPGQQHQSRGRKPSRSPPHDKQDCCSTSSSRKKSTKKSSNSTTGSKDRHHSLLAERRIPGFASEHTRQQVEPASRIKERCFSPDASRNHERRSSDFKSPFPKRSPEIRSSGRRSRSPSPSRRSTSPHTSKSRRRDQEVRSSSNFKCFPFYFPPSPCNSLLS